MGLFSKKPKLPVYDAQDCQAKKARMREIFNSLVEDGDSYRLVLAESTTFQKESGIIFDTQTTTYCHLIAGHRTSDWQTVLIQVDRELAQYGEPLYVEMDAVVETSYYPKLKQAWLIYRKDYGKYGEKLEVWDTGSDSQYAVANMQQEKEREEFLDYLESFTEHLKEKGYKFRKWKRQ